MSASEWFGSMTLPPWVRKIERDFSRVVFYAPDFELVIDMAGIPARVVPRPDDNATSRRCAPGSCWRTRRAPRSATIRATARRASYDRRRSVGVPTGPAMAVALIRDAERQ